MHCLIPAHHHPLVHLVRFVQNWDMRGQFFIQENGQLSMKKGEESSFLWGKQKKGQQSIDFLKTHILRESLLGWKCREELNKKAIDLTCYRWYRFLYRIHHTKKVRQDKEKRNLLKRKRKLKLKRLAEKWDSCCGRVRLPLRISLVNSSYSVRAVIVISFLCLLGWEDGWGVGFEVWV